MRDTAVTDEAIERIVGYAEWASHFLHRTGREGVADTAGLRREPGELMGSTGEEPRKHTGMSNEQDHAHLNTDTYTTDEHGNPIIEAAIVALPTPIHLGTALFGRIYKLAAEEIVAHLDDTLAQLRPHAEQRGTP